MPPSSIEHRRSPRYPVFLDALLTGEGFESRTCKIRDFCTGGIFLSFEGEDVAYASQRPIVPDDRVGIYFFHSNTGEESRGYELRARVVRVLTAGVGAELLTPEPAVIAALMQATKAAGTTPAEARPPTRDTATNDSKVERMATLKELRARLERAYAHWMMQLYGGMETMFLNASRDTVDAGAQRTIWQAGQLLKERRSNTITELRLVLLEQYDQAATRGVRGSGGQDGGADSAAAELSLIETDEFEQFLAVSEAVDRTETALSRILFELNQRLSYLYAARIDKGNNPFGPAAIARQFGDYVRRMRLGVGPLRVALHAFNELVVPEIRKFYEDTNHFLVDRGVPLIGETPRPKVTTSATTRRPTSPPAGPYTGAAVDQAASQLQQLAASLPQGTPLMVAPVSAFQAAHTLFGLGRGLQGPTGVPGATSLGIGATGTGAYYDSSELAAALKAMEMSIGEAAANAMTIGSMRGRIEQALAGQYPDVTPKRVRETDWDLMELVLELFNAVLNDPGVLPEVRPAIQKLRHPVNLAALSDNAFFDQAAHPARKVINNLARIRSVGEGDGKQSLLPKIDFIVDRVANEAVSRPEVFAEADAQLEAILAGQERELQNNLAELARAAEAQQQSLKARRKEGTSEARLSMSSSLGGDWLAWMNRARRLKLGEELLLGSGDQQRLAKVAWISDDGMSYVFADHIGRKIGSFGAQELAMQLRRGSARILDDLHMPAVDRAMLKSLESLHGRLTQQVHADAIASALLNEKAFNEAVEQALMQARQDKESHVLGLLSIDERASTQPLAATAREERLRDWAAQFRTALPEEAEAARTGDDHFAFLLRSCSQGRGYALLVQIQSALQGNSAAPAAAAAVKVRAGLVPFGAETLTAARVLKAAHSALELARSASSDAIRIVHVEEENTAGTRVSSRLTEQLQQALDGDGLQLVLQRIPPQSQQLASQLPTHIELMPSMLIEGGVRVSARALRIAAEQMQRSMDLDRWLLRAGMRWVAEHPERLPAQGWCIVSLSPASLRDPGLAGFISEEFINTAAPPSRFCLEVNEEENTQNHLEVEEAVHALREFGCRFMYGDFGGGSSSFSRVKALKADMVRIGRMQSRDIVSDRGDEVLVKSTAEMAHFFGIAAIADCINSKLALGKLRELGIEYAQGTAVAPVEMAM